MVVQLALEANLAHLDQQAEHQNRVFRLTSLPTVEGLRDIMWTEIPLLPGVSQGRGSEM